jgi:hypothetical protein
MFAEACGKTYLALGASLTQWASNCRSKMQRFDINRARLFKNPKVLAPHCVRQMSQELEQHDETAESVQNLMNKFCDTESKSKLNAQRNMDYDQSHSRKQHMGG